MHEALAAEMAKVTRSPNFFSEMGVLASESVTANFEQSAPFRRWNRITGEATSRLLREEMEARVGGAAQVARLRLFSRKKSGEIVGTRAGGRARTFVFAKNLAKVACQRWRRCSSICTG